MPQPARFQALVKEWPFAVAFAMVLGLIAGFGAQSWWLPADEGVYAHTTQRLLEGELPHRDFIYLHPGAVLWLDLLAFKLGGVSLAVLRWPAVWANLAQAVVVYLLLRSRGRDVAALGVVWTGAIGLPAIPSPSASVICTAFCMGALLVASQPEPWKSRRALILLGWLLGMAFLCRQLGAAYLGCGLLSWVLATGPVQDSGRGSLVGRLLLLLSALAVVLSIWSRTNLFGTLVFGAGPALLAAQALWKGRPMASVTNRLIGWVGTGFGLAFVPMLVYYACVGILGLWLREAFVASLSSFDVGFATMFRYSDLCSGVLSALPMIRSPLQVVQLSVWLGLLFATPITAAYSLYQRQVGREVPTFVFCAPFFALSALIVEIEVYLFWSLPAVLTALLAIASDRTGPRRPWCLGFAVVLLLGFLNSAVGKPVWLEPRPSFVLTQWGGRRPLVHLEGPADLYLPAPTAAFYQRSVELIHKHVGPEETIFSFPYHPEWYFLAQRKNPTRYTTPSQSISNPEQLAQMEALVRQARPKLLVYGRDDPFNTSFTRQLRQKLSDAYHLVGDENGYEFLLRND